MYGFNDDRSKVNAEDVLATNWLNGSQTGSVRTSGSKEEDSNYTIGQYAVTEGRGTYAQGNYSHAEGYDSYTIGAVSHAEGNDTQANADYSHAEGCETEANGESSHAEGFNTKADGKYSHAQNFNTVAQRKSQTAIGEFNKLDTTGADGTVRGKYALIVGNGTDANSRSDALTVDWDGNLDIAGNLQIGDSTEINKVVNYDSTVAPSSDMWKTAIHIKDKNDLSLGYLEGAVLSNGNNGMTLTARRNISGTDHYNGVRLLVDSSGNSVTRFNSPSAWREGLGLSLSSVQNIASYITSTKGTFVSGQIVTYDRIAQLIIRFRNTSAVASGANIYEGTLTKWHPVSLNGSGVNGVGYFGASALVGYINSSGGIIVRNASNSSVTINSSSNAYVTFTYLMGANQ